LEKNKDITKLINACKQQNRTAQMTLYKRYVKAMYNTALRIIGDADDAEDITQEAFIKAFSKLDSYKGTASFGAWLKKIVVNESLSWLRTHKNLSCLDKQVKLIEPETEIEVNPEKTEIIVLLEAIKKLKDNYRVVINLHYLEGYDYEEMMQILDLSYANVRTLVSRAKKKLKQILETDYQQIIK